MSALNRVPPKAASVVGLAAIALMFVACGGGGGSGGGVAPGTPTDVIFAVSNGAGAAVAGATVYLVPAADVDGSAITASDVLSGASADRDEPLEDQVRLNGATYQQAVTDAAGRATIADVATGKYFWFVEPAAGDNEHLPGGTGCRRSQHTDTLLGTTVAVTLSGKPGATASYRGSSTCLVCHASYATQAQHAHRLGFAKPGNPGSLQDLSRYPEFDDGWNLFLSAATHTGGTKVTCTDFDGTRSFDKFKTFLANPTGTVYLFAWLWRDTADGKYKITLENVINPADPASPRTLEVPLTYGGAVYKQRNLVKVPGRKGLFPLLQYQTEGNESFFDRTRKRVRDYHLDWFWDQNAQTFKDPPNNTNFDANCTACHATGFERIQDPGSGAWLTDAVDDVSGEYDLDGDGTPDELNIGCESCHGPGSDHVDWAANPANAGAQRRYIVQPAALSPSREAMICGRCHDRPLGAWSALTNEEPLNAAGAMAPVGISRSEWLANYTSTKGPKVTDVWADGLHSKSHHQQYSDLLKSTMHRNGRIITVCSDCHDSHGQKPYPHHLTDDPEQPNSNLCLKCHATDLLTHMNAVTGSTHGGFSTTCVKCHMPGTAKTGAGKYGLLLGAPNGTSGDNAKTYFENDVESHLFVVPRKTHPSVVGIAPASAMPIPYTNSCGGPCHNASTLPLALPFTAPDGPFGPCEAPGCEPDGYGPAGAAGSKEK
jgi:cytochrome c553